MKTGAFRMGCITGGAAMAVEQHNWEPFFVRKALTGEPLTIFGHKGYQVRDVIHARDLARLFLEFVKSPKRGEAYNIGGGPKNSVSLLEAVDLIEEITGRKLKYAFGPEREADHMWYVSDIGKAKHDFNWDITIDLKTTFTEIAETTKERLKAK
jgi:CDP-paratose 2-epimerase